MTCDTCVSGKSYPQSSDTNLGSKDIFRVEIVDVSPLVLSGTFCHNYPPKYFHYYIPRVVLRGDTQSFLRSLSLTPRSKGGRSS